MATANLTLSNGTKVTIEGTADEVADLLSRCSGPATATSVLSGKTARQRKTTRTKNKTSKTKSHGPQTFIDELVEEGFFKAKKTIGEIQRRLEEAGHIYALHSLSTPLLRSTRGKRLRRIKEKGVWVYVNH